MQSSAPLGAAIAFPRHHSPLSIFRILSFLLGSHSKRPRAEITGRQLYARLFIQQRLRSLYYAYVVSHPKSKEGRVARKMGAHTCAQLCALSDGRAPCVGSMWCGSTDRSRWSETNAYLVHAIGIESAKPQKTGRLLLPASHRPR